MVLFFTTNKKLILTTLVYTHSCSRKQISLLLPKLMPIFVNINNADNKSTSCFQE